MDPNHSANHSDKRDYTIAVLDSALRVLETFLVDGRGSQGTSEISSHLGLSRGKVFRILQTLEAAGYVRQDAETKRYRLGLKLFAFGQAVAHGFDLVRVADAVLVDLTEQTGETSYVYALDGLEAVTVAKQECTQPMRISAAIGRRDTLEVGAACNTLLAYRSPSEIEAVLGQGPIPAQTTKTLTDPEAIKAKLAEIRRLGYHVSLEEEQEGVNAIAAPIRDSSGAVIAAVAIAIPTPRFVPEQTPRLVEHVCRAAQRISAELGHLPEPARPALGHARP